MDQDAAAARRRFPARAEAITELAARDEAFRDMCADFAIAQVELQKWTESTDRKRDQRCAEYRTLVDDLEKEIAAAIDAAAVVPFPRR